MFAICPGDGEATPVRCPGGGDAFGGAALAGEAPSDAAAAIAGELADEGDAACAAGEAALAGELPGDAAGAVAGELPGEEGGPTFAEASAGELAAPAGAGDSSGAGARAPMFARSWPIRIFPRNTGRSKM